MTMPAWERQFREASVSSARDHSAELWNRNLICESIHRLNWLSDGNQLDELLNPFTDDLYYEVEGMATFHDKPALREFMEQVVGSFSMRIHRTSNEIIELKGDVGEARSYWRADLDLKGCSIVSAGHYFDEFRLLNGLWRVSSRRATLTYITPLDEGWGKTRFFSLA
jgi:hypothetical protein